MQKRVLPPFGEAVAAVLSEHGLSDRAAQYRTGIDRITMADMRNGYVPRLEQVERFARGFGLDVDEWRVNAGYEPVLPAGVHRLQQGLQELFDETAGDWQWFIRGMTQEEREAFTPEQAEADLDDMRTTLQRRPAPDFFHSASGRISAWDAKKHPLGFPVPALPEDQRKPVASDTDTPTGAELLMQGIAELRDRARREQARPLTINFDEELKAKLTVEEAEQALAVYRRQYEAGLL